MLGELALRDQHLAAAAQAAAAAYRIDVHAEAARGLQQRRAHRKMAALAGRREDDERIAGRHAHRAALSRPAAMTAFAAAARRSPAAPVPGAAHRAGRGGRGSGESSARSPDRGPA